MLMMAVAIAVTNAASTVRRMLKRLGDMLVSLVVFDVFLLSYTNNSVEN